MSATAPPLAITMIVGDQQIDRRVLDQARSLIQAGCRVTVIAGALPPGNRDEASYPDVPIVRIQPGTQVDSFDARGEPRLPAALRKDFGQWFHDHPYLLDAALQHEAQIYTAHDLPQLPAAAIAAQCNNAYLVFDAHELFPERQFYTPQTIHFLQDLERELLPLADLTITVNKSIAELMAVRYGIDLPRVILNCPAVHGQDLPDGASDQLRQSLALTPDQKILLFQGNLNPNRNLDGLVRAMAQVQDERVVLVFMGGGGLRQTLEELSAELGLLGRRIFFHGAVPQHELLAYTASADGGVIPYPHVDLNTYFCTPNKLFEFIVAGLPILANDSPELNRFVERQGVGLNHAMRTPEQLAQAIDAFFAGELESWRAQARALAERYTWATERHAFLEAYGSLGGVPSKAAAHQSLYDARVAFEHGHVGQALAVGEQVVQLMPQHKDALNLLADIAYSQVQLDEALQLTRQVLQMVPQDPYARRRKEAIEYCLANLMALERPNAA